MTQDAKQAKQSGGAEDTPAKGDKEERASGEQKVAKEDKTKTEPKEEVKDSAQKTEERVTREGVTQDVETRAVSEHFYDTRESPVNARRKTSITQKIKGMLRKGGDTKVKEKQRDKSEVRGKSEAQDKSETRGDGGSSKRGLSFKYYKRKGKGKSKGKGKEDPAVESKTEEVDSARRQVGQQAADGSKVTQKETDQQGSAMAAPQQQRLLRDTQSAPPPHKPGMADGRKSAPEPSTPAGEKNSGTGLQQQDSAGSSYVTAQSTMRRTSRKPRLTRTKRLEAFPSTCDPGSPRSPPPSQTDAKATQDTSRGSRGTGESQKGTEEEEDEAEDETTRLLNRVLRAIQILEKERPELVEEAAKEEEKKEREEEAAAAQRASDHPRTLGRMKVSYLPVVIRVPGSFSPYLTV